MAASAERLLQFEIPDCPHEYSARESILYALAIGLGADCNDAREQPFLNEGMLQALPTMGVVLGYPGFWLMNPGCGVDWRNVLHGEQGLVLHNPIPSSGSVVGKTRVVDLVDRGSGNGALLFVERVVYDARTSKPYCTLTQTMMLRGDGGCGGQNRPLPRPYAVPDREPDFVHEMKTSPRAALLYGLLGDRNPLHYDLEVARSGGFDRPILQGLCTFGIAGYAILLFAGDGASQRLRSMHGRFTSHVFPGETLRTEIWRDGNSLGFRVFVLERNVFAINNGRAELQ